MTVDVSEIMKKIQTRHVEQMKLGKLGQVKIEGFLNILLGNIGQFVIKLLETTVTKNYYY